MNILQNTVGRTDHYCMFNIRGITHRHVYSDFRSQFTQRTHT